MVKNTTRPTSLVIDGLTGTVDPMVVELTVINHPVMFGTEYNNGAPLSMHDGGGTGQFEDIDIEQFTFGGGYSSPMQGALSPDGRHAYYGLRNQPAIVTIDTTTLIPTIGADLTGGTIAYDGSGSLGFTRAVAISPDGLYLYVTLTTNMHPYEGSVASEANNSGNGNASIEIVKLDRSTMQEVGRVVLGGGLKGVQGRQVQLSADGAKGAVALKVFSAAYGEPANDVQGKFYVFDTATMMVIDGDPNSSSDAFDVSAVGMRVDTATMSPDGSKVYVAISDGDSDLRAVDVATGTISSLPTTTSCSAKNRTQRLAFGPDGRLFWATFFGFCIYDFNTSTWMQPILVGATPIGFDFGGCNGQYYVFHKGSATVQQFSLSDDLAVPNPADGSATVPTDYIQSGHAELVTPF
jgi:hypothetical protein